MFVAEYRSYTAAGGVSWDKMYVPAETYEEARVIAIRRLRGWLFSIPAEEEAWFEKVLLYERPEYPMIQEERTTNSNVLKDPRGEADYKFWKGEEEDGFTGPV